MKSVQITLGEKQYTVTQLPLRQLCAWQKQVTTHAKAILDVAPSLVKAFGPLLKDVPQDASTPQATASGLLNSLTEDTLPGLISAGLSASDAALDAFPAMLDLLFDFDGALKLDKERIEQETTQEEVVAAFIAIVKFSFPFGMKLGDLFKALGTTTAASGGTTATTLPTSPSPNGGDGMTTSRSSKLPA